MNKSDSRPAPRRHSGRRIAAHWHRNQKALDVVVGPAHITLTRDEAQSLHGQLGILLSTAPANP